MPLPPTVDLAQRNTVRLVSTGRLKDPALLPLAAEARALDDLASLESATNARLRAEEAGLADLDPRELVFGRAGRTFVNAAFTHTRPGGNRFNGDGRGAWYAGFEPRTALAEVAYHLARELEAIGRFENVTDYAELVADFFGPFHDLRGIDAAEPCLNPDPAIGYPAGQALAHRLRVEVGSNGIVYPSVRRPGGTGLAAFRPDLVQNLREGVVWRLTWHGTPAPRVTREAG
jgi:RES domain-containing protein